MTPRVTGIYSIDSQCNEENGRKIGRGDYRVRRVTAWLQFCKFHLLCLSEFSPQSHAETFHRFPHLRSSHETAISRHNLQHLPMKLRVKFQARKLFFVHSLSPIGIIENCDRVKRLRSFRIPTVFRESIHLSWASSQRALLGEPRGCVPFCFVVLSCRSMIMEKKFLVVMTHEWVWLDLCHALKPIHLYMS